MREPERQENPGSNRDEDEDVDPEVLAFRDAMRDIFRSEGRFELLVP